MMNTFRRNYAFITKPHRIFSNAMARFNQTTEQWGLFSSVIKSYDSTIYDLKAKCNTQVHSDSPLSQSVIHLKLHKATSSP